MTAPTNQRLRAYKVYAVGFGADPVAIVSAETRAQAKGRSFSDAHEAGYRLQWWDLRALRAPNFDRLAELYGRFGWTPQHARTMLEMLKP